MDVEMSDATSNSSSYNRMAISNIAPAGCDTILPPTRLYSSRRSITPASTPESDSGSTTRRVVRDSDNDPNLSSDVSGLHRAEQQAIVSFGSESNQDSTSTIPSSAKGKGKETSPSSAEEWLQPPGRKLCSRHQRMADEGTNLLLQKTIDSLPLAEREAVSNIWSSFSASSHQRRALILQGILTMCCQSELSLLSEQLAQINRVDPFSLFPRELSLKILGYVDAKSLTRAAQVSRLWRSIADDDILWKNMCEQHIERKCHKCGWGLPLLDRRATKSGANSPTGAGASGTTAGFKRPLPETVDEDDHDHDEPTERPAKRARSDPPLQLLNQLTPPPAPQRPLALPRMATAGPFLHGQPLPPNGHSSSSSAHQMFTLPMGHIAITRPWKDVYSERLTIARNWRLGRSSVTVLKGHTDGVMCLQYNDKLQHPSFPILMTGSYDRTVRVWNAETGQEVLRLLGHTRAIRALQFDECKLVTGSMDRTLRLWNWRTGQCIRTLEGHTAGVVCLAFDSNVLVSGSVDRTVKVWNFRNGDCFTLRGHMDWVNSVKIWDRFSDLPTGDIDPAAPPPALDPGKMLFSASDDGTIRLWDLTSRACVRQFEGHVGQVQSIQIAMVDDAEEERPQEEDPNAAGPSSQSSAHSAVSNVTPILISGSLDNTIRTWDVETGKKLNTLFGHIEGVWAIASDKLRLVSGSHDKTIKIWNRSEGKCTATLVGHRGAVTCLALGDDKIVSGSDDGDVRIWSFGGGGSSFMLGGHQPPSGPAQSPSPSST